MQTYGERTGQQPAFEVRYRFLAPAEGGRSAPPRQHVRWDFLYEGDDPHHDGISMVWPEFIGPSGSVLPEGEVPLEGRALMFIVNPSARSFTSSELLLAPVATSSKVRARSQSAKLPRYWAWHRMSSNSSIERTSSSVLRTLPAAAHVKR
jgi:hypothetical protein